MKFAKTLLSAAAMALACGFAYGADDKQSKGFNDLDKNNDGKLSRAEAAGNKTLISKWKELDADGDGSLSRTEYLKEMAKQDAGAAKKKVSGEDKQRKDNRQAKGFNDMDKNKDGKLSRTEAAGNKTLISKWKELDTDNDGSLSRAEYLKEMAKQDAAKVTERVSKGVDSVKNRTSGDASTGGTAQSQRK
jgi:Ca2+-binding EF-hand superfamily protein